MEVYWIHRWIPRWNKFLQIRQGVPVVTRFGLLFTLVGLLLYVVDMVTDIVTAITYIFAGQYWKFTFTLILVYGSIIVQTVWKWHRDGINKSCPFVGLLDLGSLVTNWSGFQECWTLFRVERLLYKSSKSNAQLVLELQDRRRNVALLKITEGICEACPQAILQVYLLLNSLEGNLTLTSGFRIVSVMISLCSAGAAVFNWKKSDSILDNKEISISEMVVLLGWVVPITASRLLSTGLLLVIHPYVGLVCIILHIVLYTVYLIIATEYCRTFEGALYACMVSIWFFMSPFNIIDTFTYRVIPPVIHVVGNAAATVTWALNTTLLCTHPVLYACIIITDCTFFTAGIIFCIIYSKWCR